MTGVTGYGLRVTGYGLRVTKDDIAGKTVEVMTEKKRGKQLGGSKSYQLTPQAMRDRLIKGNWRETFS